MCVCLFLFCDVVAVCEEAQAGSWGDCANTKRRDGREFFLTSDGESGSRSALLASSSTAAIELITLYAWLDNAVHKMALPLPAFFASRPCHGKDSSVRSWRTWIWSAQLGFWEAIRCSLCLRSHHGGKSGTVVWFCVKLSLFMTMESFKNTKKADSGNNIKYVIKRTLI